MISGVSVPPGFGSTLMPARPVARALRNGAAWLAASALLALGLFGVAALPGLLE